VTRRTRGFVVRSAVSLSLLASLAVIIDPGAVLDSLRRLRPGWVLAALGVSVLQVTASAWRWRYTAGRLGVELPLRRAVSEYYLASFLNQILPGGVLGDVSRAWRHARVASVRSTGGEASLARSLPSVHAVILERLSGQVVMIVVAACSAAFLGGLRAVAVVLAGCLAASFLVRGVRRHARIPGTASFADNARAAFGGGALPVQLATSLLVVASYLGVYLMGSRAVGVQTPVAVLVPLVAPVLVSMLLPVTVAGWGVREGAAAALWSAVGLPAHDGVAISVAYGLLVLIATLPGAVIVVLTLWRGRDPRRTKRRHPDGRRGSAGEAPPRASRWAGASGTDDPSRGGEEPR